ncbi:MAG TPA: sigma 54-interacting transcriptional regulator [Polyangiaceae bacterium]|nr:sigma 54-interacting transcriptional regulator [Polyangiaceae bacterium]
MSQPAGKPSSTMATHAVGPAANAPAALSVVVLSGQARGARAALGEKVRIGKAPDNELVLTDATVSRHHCEVERVGGEITLRDLDSTNHTKVGGAIVKTAVLTQGTTFTVGDVDLMLHAEPQRMQVPPSEQSSFGDAVGPSLTMRNIFGVLERIAPSAACVLLEGETGTGKDVLARGIHANSPRSADPFVIVDCGAVSYNLVESELFGHERGAFTSAVSTRVGAFELAGNGTLFLDEVGELPLDIQPKLLRVLESGEFRRVGGNKVFKSKARVIAATKRNLKEEVARGKFREDLYFRLAVVPIVVPALRTHREDIPALIQHFLKLAQARDPRLAEVALSQQTIAGLSAHDWPGNVRELRNVLDRALYMAAATGESELQLVDFPVAPNGASNFFGAFDEAKSYRDIRAEVENEFEKHYVTWLLSRHDGNLSGAARAAKMDRKHLHDLARKHGLRGK